MRDQNKEPVTPSFLAPVAASHFFSEYFGRKRLLVQRREPDYFRGVLDIEEFDRLVTSTRLPPANLTMAKGDTPIPQSEYVVGGTAIDQRRVIAHHQAGVTIILRAAEQWSPALNGLRVAAEDFFGVEAQTNVYLTPAQQKSTPPHWDTHDLFIMQLEGSKRWRLFRGARTLPLADERFRVGEDYVSPDCEEIVLHPGDTLYLPRGVIHEPVAETYSVHVSVGVLVTRYYDLLSTALRLLAEREGSWLREAVPTRAGMPRQDLDDALAAELLKPEVIGRAVATLHRRFSATRGVDLQGWLTQTARATVGEAPPDRYCRRGGMSLHVSEVARGIQLAAGTQTVVVPRSLKDAIDYILHHDSFDANELPGGQSAEDRLALCLALRRIGALKAADPSVSGAVG